MISLCVVILVKIFIIFLSLMYIPKDPSTWLADGDQSFSPCEDFYHYACGGFLEKTKLPPAQSRYTRSFDIIRGENEKKMVEIMESTSDPILHPYYQTCLNLDNIEKEGTKHIQVIFDEIDTYFSKPQSQRNLGKFLADTFHSYGISALFTPYALIDSGNPKHMTLALFPQGSYLLPQSLYKDASQHRVYLSHIEKMFSLYQSHLSKNPTTRKRPIDPPHTLATAALNFESKLAASAPHPTQMRDPNAIYNMYSQSSLSTLFPSLNFHHYFSSLDLTVGQDDSVQVISPSFMRDVAHLLGGGGASENDFRAYLQWMALHATARYLPSGFGTETFGFFDSHLRGRKEEVERPVWCVREADRDLGMLVGKYFIEKHFSEQSKERVLDVLKNMKRSYRGLIESLDWMDHETRTKALEKLDLMYDMIGYPDEFEDYSDVADHTLGSSFFTNKMYLRRRNVLQSLSLSFKATDKTKWEMTPPTVNAYYEPTANEIVFPAGILQYPFYHAMYPSAMVYGGIGSVIGHEISHGVDDEGSKFDASGKLEMWWSKSTRERYEEKADCVRDVYGSYEPIEGKHINGNLTSGENIADNVGVKDAFLALKEEIGEKGMKEHSVLLPELTNEQLFFISFAQVWCTVQSDEILEQRLLLDPHSPPEFRVIGTISNSEYFASAFECKVGQKMNPYHKCKILR